MAVRKVRNHIPQDLALLVLSKLPLKSLKRFGCVHKPWSLLFENQYFITMFGTNFISISHSYYDDTSLILHQVVYNKSRRTVSYLHLLSSQSFENRLKLDLPTPLQQEDPIFYIRGSSTNNGTLCLSNADDSTLVLWNPTTDEIVVIPSSPMESVSPYWSTLISFHGFGYDRVRDDYKIIRCLDYFPLSERDLFYLNLPEEAQSEKIFYDNVWEIYSLRCNTWEKLDVNMLSDTNQHILYTNDGICHWLNNDDRLWLVSFDLSSYVYFTTSTPITIPTRDANFKYGMAAQSVVLNGSIALISWYPKTTTFDISILGELGVSESWTKLFTIGPFPFSIERPIGAGRNGDIFFKKKGVSMEMGFEPLEFAGLFVLRMDLESARVSGAVMVVFGVCYAGAAALVCCCSAFLARSI
ncbi:F-box protein interaction domain protein [Medicago truncatula]|uniref:F-box protein interaction domain protein n=1 Tax=Medicago truncatula TaxID=3880 RepID=A0A072TLT4_MEDTR|nr:F-box protein interaction domain protein [Medicago truncatula]